MTDEISPVKAAQQADRLPIYDSHGAIVGWDDNEQAALLREQGIEV